jgi:GLPGLI family protein
MKILIIFCSLAIAATFTGLAQTQFLYAGKVEFEKKVNMHKFIEDDSWTREFKDKMPVYRVSYYDYFFDSTSSVFKAGRELPEDKWRNFWGTSSGDENIFHSDFAKGTTSEMKQVYEKKFLMQDSLLNIEWRITDEIRTIAGFDCRKAVGRFLDSLYVIAFYTDQITAPGGPGPYQGLPGMILGLAFPRYFTTIFATKVELITPKPTDLKVPSGKATVTNRKNLIEQVYKAIEWGTPEEKQKRTWNMVL